MHTVPGRGQQGGVGGEEQLGGLRRCFADRSYIKPVVVQDLRDHPVFPLKGVMLEASHKQAYGKGASGVGPCLPH